MYEHSSSPDGVLDPELQRTGLGALQPGEQAGHAARPAVRRRLLILLGHHVGPRGGCALGWAGREAWEGVLGLDNMDWRSLRC